MKKGFTIVELIIVIAVIGVLAAILIPTFAGVIRKANISSDISLCKNMNTANAIGDKSIEDMAAPNTIDAVLVNLAANGYPMDNLLPKTKNTAFYWLRDKNQIIYVDQADAVDPTSSTFDTAWEVLFPAEYTGLTVAEKTELFFVDNGVGGTIPNYFSITIKIEPDMDWVAQNMPALSAAAGPSGTPTEVTIESAGQLAALSYLMSTVDGSAEHSNFENVTIKLTSDIYIGSNTWSPIGAPVRSGSVDIAGTGTVVSFSHNTNKEYRFAGTFDGQGHTISGLSMDADYEPDCVYQNRFALDSFTFALFGSTYDAVIKNVKLTGVHIDNRGLETPDGDEICGDSVAALVGLSSGSLTVENCTVSGSVIGWDCVSGIVARHYGSADLTIRNCTNNATIIAYGIDGGGQGKKAGGILGYAGNDFRDVLIENVVNNGDVHGGTAGGIASYMNSSGLANDGVIVLRNCTNNGDVDTSFESVNFVAGGAGGIFGNIFHANSNVEGDFSILENVINNGDISNDSGTYCFGMMGDINSAIMLKGRIENHGNVFNVNGLTGVVSGMFGNTRASVNVTVDAGASLKQYGTVTANCLSGAYGCFAGISANSVVNINGSIDQRGDVTNTYGPTFGLFGSIAQATLNFNTGSVVKMSGDLRGWESASGVIGTVTTTTTNTVPVITIYSGASVQVSGSIIATSSNYPAGHSRYNYNDKAYASGFALGMEGKATSSASFETSAFQPQLIVNGSLLITSPTISASSNSSYKTTSITYATVASGITPYAYLAKITFGPSSNAIIQGCAITAISSDPNSTHMVFAAGVVGYARGINTTVNGVNTEVPFTLEGNLKIQNCSVYHSATATTAANQGSNLVVAKFHSSYYHHEENFSLLNLGGNTVNGAVI